MKHRAAASVGTFQPILSAQAKRGHELRLCQ
jgi:hypothetical protein